MMAVIITMTAFAHSLPGLLAQLQTYTSPPGADYIRILPELVLSIFGMLIMVVDPLLDEDSSHQALGTIALIGALAALASTIWMAQYPGTAFWNMVRVEDFSVFFTSWSSRLRRWSSSVLSNTCECSASAPGSTTG